MLSYPKHVWSWLRDWLPYVLPAISNLILVLLGVIMSLPALAEKVEKTPKYRKCLAAICLIAGVIGFIFDVAQRHSSDETNKQLIENVGITLKKTDELVQQTTGMLATTNQMATTVAVYMPQIAEMNSHVAAIDKQLKTTNDPRLIADLQAQKAEVQKQAAAISKRMSIALVPEIVHQMRDAHSNYLDEAFRLYNETDSLTSGPWTPETPQKLTEKLTEVKADRLRLDNRYRDELKEMVSTADYLRRQLLQVIPQTDEDKAEEQSFSAAINGDTKSFDVWKATKYLESLAQRNR